MKITFEGWKNHSTKNFKLYTLIPTIDLVIDRQMEEVVTFSDGEKVGGEKVISFGFLWLMFAVWINFEIDVTKK